MVDEKLRQPKVNNALEKNRKDFFSINEIKFSSMWLKYSFFEIAILPEDLILLISE